MAFPIQTRLFPKHQRYRTRIRSGEPSRTGFAGFLLEIGSCVDPAAAIPILVDAILRNSSMLGELNSGEP
jgi:hypothetical protein